MYSTERARTNKRVDSWFLSKSICERISYDRKTNAQTIENVLAFGWKTHVVSQVRYWRRTTLYWRGWYLGRRSVSTADWWLRLSSDVRRCHHCHHLPTTSTAAVLRSARQTSRRCLGLSPRSARDSYEDSPVHSIRTSHAWTFYINQCRDYTRPISSDEVYKPRKARRRNRCGISLTPQSAVEKQLRPYWSDRYLPSRCRARYNECLAVRAPVRFQKVLWPHHAVSRLLYVMPKSDPAKVISGHNTQEECCGHSHNGHTMHGATFGYCAVFGSLCRPTILQQTLDCFRKF